MKRTQLQSILELMEYRTNYFVEPFAAKRKK